MSVIALPKGTTSSLRDIGRLQDIPAVRQLGLFAMVAATIALGLWLFFWTQRADYVPVFAGLDAKATSEASELLRSNNIAFRIDPVSGALAVPTDQIGAAKMALAVAGLPASSAAGFESMQGDQGFGTSQFIESARYQHALEIELARTITNLRPVREARVHLALPRASAFTRQNNPASASVVLQLQNGGGLEQGQVDAIVHLVASSIPGLPPSGVTVVDQTGRMLSNADPDSEEAVGAKQFEQQRRQESVYVQRIQQLLEPMTGRGRVSTQVSVDMDFAQTEEARESYGPQGSMVRSEQISESGNLGGAAAMQAQGGAAAMQAQGVPGAVSNTPGSAAAAAPPPAAAPAAAPASGTGARTAVRNFEIDRTLTHTRQAPGRIRRVTAAVLVDNLSVGATKAGKKPTLRALNAAELARIQTLVQQAIGFDAQRGDVVSVVNAKFAIDAEDSIDAGLPIWQEPKARELLRTVLGGLAVLLLIFTVLRPAFRQLLIPRTSNTQVNVHNDVDVDVDLDVAMATGPARASAARVPNALMNFDDKLDVARTAVSTDAKRVAQVVRDMVDSDD
ncbi:MAG: flagellar basal-body MS-ring/collar protein FliF [Thermomonas sp.]